MHPLRKRPFARIIYVIKHIVFVFAVLLSFAYPIIHFGWTTHEHLISSIVDGMFVYVCLSWVWEGFVLRGTALVNEDREVMKALVQYKKSVDENIEYVSFLNKKMDAISERIKESGDQQCMKKLLDIYAKYPIIQRQLYCD